MAGSPATATSYRVSASLVVVCLLLLAPLLGILAYPARINHDAAMCLQMGDFLIAGRMPYVDMVAIDPPLIVYLSAIPAAAGRILGMPLPLAFQLSVWLLTAWSAISSLRILGPAFGGMRTAGVCVAAGLVVFSTGILFRNDFGQREHLFVLAFMPYFLARCRSENEQRATLGRPSRIGLGIVAGIGACLKPHFVLIALVAEVCWLTGRRRRQWVLPAELLAFAATGLVYAAHILAVPEPMRSAWFDRWLPLAMRGYRAYDAPIEQIVAHWKLWAPTLIGVAVFLVWTGRTRYKYAVALSALTATANVFLQQKGWPYHAIPAQALFVVMASLVAASMIDGSGVDRLKGHESSRLTRLARIAALLLILTGVAGAAVLSLQRRTSRMLDDLTVTDPVARVIATHTRVGDPVFVISTSVFPTYPLLTQLDRRQASRFMFTFPLPLIYVEARPSAARETFSYDLTDPWLSSQERQFRQDMDHDLRTRRPNLVLVTSTCQGCPAGFSVVDYLEASGFLETSLADFDEVEPAGDTRVYLRRGRPLTRAAHE